MHRTIRPWFALTLRANYRTSEAVFTFFSAVDGQYDGMAVSRTFERRHTALFPKLSVYRGSAESTSRPFYGSKYHATATAPRIGTATHAGMSESMSNTETPISSLNSLSSSSTTARTKQPARAATFFLKSPILTGSQHSI